MSLARLSDPRIGLILDLQSGGGGGGRSGQNTVTILKCTCLEQQQQINGQNSKELKSPELPHAGLEAAECGQTQGLGTAGGQGERGQ